MKCYRQLQLCLPCFGKIFERFHKSKHKAIYSLSRHLKVTITPVHFFVDHAGKDVPYGFKVFIRWNRGRFLENCTMLLLANEEAVCLLIQKYRIASETTFKWRFAGGPLVTGFLYVY